MIAFEWRGVMTYARGDRSWARKSNSGHIVITDDKTSLRKRRIGK